VLSQTLQIPTARVFEPLLEPYWGAGTKGRYKGAYGGRGSGKSHFFADMAVERCMLYPGTRIVCVREVQKSLKESVKRLVEDKIDDMGVSRQFGILHDSIKAPGNGIILFQGMQDHTAESIKSLEGFDIGYVEEAQTMTARSLEMLRPTIRRDPAGGRPGSELWFSWNPRHTSDPVDELLRGPEPPPSAVVVRANYMDNPFFPLVMEEERAYDEGHKPERYAHIWLGEYEPMAVGAIFNRGNIQRNRRPPDPDRLPDMERILVAIDPAVTADGDQHGIVVVAKGADNRGYVLADGSTAGSPGKWARTALALYDEFEADAIVAEVNQGGDLVKENIRAHRQDVAVIEVRASRGKHKRAEPIAALYEQDRISHVGSFPELEHQLCLITHHGYEGEDSPDRADAMVWGFTELFPRMVRRTPTKNRPSRANRDGYNPLRGLR